MPRRRSCACRSCGRAQARAPPQRERRVGGPPALKEEEFARAVALGLWDYLRKSRAQATSCRCRAARTRRRARARRDCGRARVRRARAGGFRGKICRGPRLLGARGRRRRSAARAAACAYQPTRERGAVTRGRRRARRRVRSAPSSTSSTSSARARATSRSIEKAIGRKLTWEKDDLALQNIQARVRAPSIWMLANLAGAVLLTTWNRSRGGGRLRDDGRRHRAAGSRRSAASTRRSCGTWLRWMEKHGPVGLEPMPALAVINAQQPTAELRPQEQRRRPTRPT